MLYEIKKDAQGNVVEKIDRNREFVSDYMIWLDEH